MDELSPSEESPNVVDKEGLAKLLKVKPRTIREFWRELPHVFVGAGRDLRSARFVVDDVLLYLRKRDYRADHIHLIEAGPEKRPKVKKSTGKREAGLGNKADPFNPLSKSSNDPDPWGLLG